VKSKFLPVGMILEQRMEDAVQDFAPLIERPEVDLAPGGDDLEWRTNRRDVPARVPFRIFVARGQVDAAISVQLAQQVLQAFFKRDSGCSASDGDPAGRGVNQFRHKATQEQSPAGRS